MPLSAVDAQFVIISAASVVATLILSKVSLDCLAPVSAMSRNCCGASGLGERVGVVLGLVFIRPSSLGSLDIWERRLGHHRGRPRLPNLRRGNAVARRSFRLKCEHHNPE